MVPEVSIDRSSGIAKEIRVFAKPEVLMALGVIVFGFGGLFTVFSYIAPVLLELTAFKEQDITLILALFGISVTLGNIFGGKLADWRLKPSLITNLILLCVVLIMLQIFDPYKIPALILIFIWGFLSFSIVPALQVRVLAAAKEAPTLAATTIHSAFNTGNAGGAALGGLIVGTIGLIHLPWAAALVTLLGLVLLLLSLALYKS